MTLTCPACGSYTVTGSAWAILKGERWRAERWKLSGVVRNAAAAGGEVHLTSETIPSYLATSNPPKDPLELIDRIVLWLATRRGDDPDLDSHQVVQLTDFPLFYRRDEHAFWRALNLVANAGFVEPFAGFLTEEEVWPPVKVTMTLAGWRHAATLRSTARSTWQAFVAMWFSADLSSAFTEGIAPALRSTGYEAVRVDALQHNEKIDDRIIAEIRRSGLVVADFTGHRGGVYFEAGFARGLGVPLIWTCREDAIATAHFDTRQFNHITWATPAELREKLQNRIRATLPTREPLPEVADG